MMDRVPDTTDSAALEPAQRMAKSEHYIAIVGMVLAAMLLQKFAGGHRG
jgi:hypothetical protein